MMKPENDAELICRAQAGDRLAAGALSERYRRKATAAAYAALRNADDAEDAAQESLVYALQRLPDLRDPDRFPAWLRQIVLSRCADYRRRCATRKLGTPLSAQNEASEEADLIERLAVRQAVARLPEIHRTTVLLHYLGGWSLREVADLLEVPLNTVKSRLRNARLALREDLHPTVKKEKPMSKKDCGLTQAQRSLLSDVYPDARILGVEAEPDPWMPFSPRLKLSLPGGEGKTVDFRSDIDPDREALLPVLERLDIPGPQIIRGPVTDGSGYLTLCEPPRGENLHHWATGGTPHRLRLAAERTFEAVDRLQGITGSLQTDPSGAKLPRLTLFDEAEMIEAKGGDWLQDPWFVESLKQVKAAVKSIRDPLVYTHYLHFHPNWLYIRPGDDPFDTPLGWPGDARLRKNPLAEVVSPFGYFGDPLLGLTMIWIYDCYPFVHTGLVEQFLWRRDATRRDFGPRLALRALQTLQKELPVARPPEGADYWDALHGYVRQGLEWGAAKG
ncbi:MAG: RNA polymerase sigma factor [Armatimonadetes bacterium]|nr:RNA polymerase sigma factor [Armatimonadota bacterium]